MLRLGQMTGLPAAPRTQYFAIAAFLTLRAHAARKPRAQVGLKVAVGRADCERPLCGEVEGSDVLKKLPKFSLGRYAHGSIRVQEGQPLPAY